MELDIIVANPSGNVTIFVMTPVLRKDYVNVAGKLLALSYKAEQVAFVTGKDSFEMAGLEFCGNATRAFGLIMTKGEEIQTLSVKTSGMDAPVSVTVDPAGAYSAADMPLPLSIKEIFWEIANLRIKGNLVDFGGILHLTLSQIPATSDNFVIIKERILRDLDPPALGVMFCHDNYRSMVPVVYVRDVDTVFFEGSCASGTAAVACARAEEGTSIFTICQPDGCLSSRVTKKGGRLLTLTVEGTVDLSPLISVTI